jgi:plastocyanin
MTRGLLISAVLFSGALTIAATADPVVVQRQKAFAPAEIAIKAGQRIVFLNGDSVTHNIYSRTPGAEFEIRHQAPGRSDTVAFARAGELVVECAIHPSMRLTVRVAP